MELSKLQQIVRELATIEENRSHFLSCYLNVEGDRRCWSNILEERIGLLKLGLHGAELSELNESYKKILAWMNSELKPQSQGVALFSRAGEQPYFRAMQFRVSLPNWVARSTAPNIYHLVELKDSYHRYIVLITTETSARIIEVNLGAATEQLWAERIDLRNRVARGWSKQFYQHYGKDRDRQFVRQKIRILDQLISAGGHTHFMIVGKQHLTAQIKNELPAHLRNKLVDVVNISAESSDVVSETLQRFLEREEQESRSMAEVLTDEISTGGLAVAGAWASFQALRRGQADVLILLRDFDPEFGRYCPMCMFLLTDVSSSQDSECPRCKHPQMLDVLLREELVRLAEQGNCMVEVVNESSTLSRLGGVGCLLRYWIPEYQELYS